MAEMKISSSSWKKQLDQKLVQAAVKSQSKRLDLSVPTRIALVGVGSELNGDDAAGIWVARKLKAARGVPAHFLALDGGSLPENASGPLRRFKPDIVLLVDAADMGQPVGTIQWLLSEQIGGMSASSHTLPLPVLGQFLESEFGCTVEYLGIQPGQLEYTLPMSAEVEKAVAQIVREVKKQIIARRVTNG